MNKQVRITTEDAISIRGRFSKCQIVGKANFAQPHRFFSHLPDFVATGAVISCCHL